MMVHRTMDVGRGDALPYSGDTCTCIRKQSKKIATTDDTAAEHVVMCGDTCEKVNVQRPVKEA